MMTVRKTILIIAVVRDNEEAFTDDVKARAPRCRTLHRQVDVILQ